jgi:hypothetical protein
MAGDLTAEEISFLLTVVTRVGHNSLIAATLEPAPERVARAEWIAELVLKLRAIRVENTSGP